jgi:RNA polymerase-interacting CarD/CdnL/TRCF family regulator
MIKALEQAVDTAKMLSPERQADIAEVIRDMAAAGDAKYVLSAEERRLLREGLDELDRGERATPDEVRAVFDKYRT